MHHYQRSKNQFNSYSFEDKADFRVLKIKFDPSVHSWDTVNFRAAWTGWPHLFLNIPTPIFLINVWFVLTCTKSDYFIDFFCDVADQKILQSNWMRTFGPYLRNKSFPKYGIFCRNMANNINKLNTVLGPFLVHFAFLAPKKTFPGKSV